MKPIPGHIETLLYKYTNNQCDKQEIEALQEWLKQEGSQQILEQYLSSSKNNRDKKIPDAVIDSVWSKVLDDIGEGGKDDSTTFNVYKRKPDAKPLSRVLLQTAASIILLIGLVFVFNHSFVSQQEEKVLAQAPKWIEKSAQAGKKLSFTLKDGSKIKLNNLSSVSFREDFLNDSIRYVKLEGEAFFEVVKSSKPFVVESGEVTTTVLGTAFNIKNLAHNKVKIALVHGKVKVSRSKENLLLSPKEMAVFDQGSFLKKPFDEQEEIGWKDGVLHLKGERFDEIVSRLEAWYGVEIKVTGEIKGRGFDKTYKNASLKRVLEGLSFIAAFEYEISDNHHVIINPKN